MAVSKNITIEANGLQGDDLGRVLGYNVTTQGVYTPVVGTCLRDSIATYIDRNGVMQTAPANQLRVDWTNGVAEILLEPASTNLIVKSEDPNGGQWINTGGSLESGFTSPNGDSSAYRQSAFDRSRAGISVVFTKSNILNDVYSSSFFIKCDTQDVGKTITAQLSRGSGDYFEPINANITLTNEWQKVTMENLVFPSSGEFNNVSINIYRSSDTAEISALQVWGVQLEELSSATSYIPTNGAIATRQADSLTDFGFSQIIDSESGILFFEGSFLNNDNGTISLTDSISSPTKSCLIRLNSGGSIQGTYNGVNNFYPNAIINQNYKVALKYGGGNVELLVNNESQGITPTTIFAEDSFTTLNARLFQAQVFYGRIRQLKTLPYDTNVEEL